LDWFYELGDQFLFLTKDGPSLIDAKTGETRYTIKEKYNGKVDPVMMLDNQLMFFYKKRISLVDIASATETMSIEGKVEEASSFKTLKIGGKTYVFFGFNNRLIAFDGDSGGKLWETAEGSVEGSVRWVSKGSDGSVLIVTLRSDKFGKDAGTWLKMYSFNADSGAINWSQMIGRGLGASVFVNKAFSNDSSVFRGMDIGIWFEEPIVDGDNLIFLMKSVVSGDPVTLDLKDSQGFISINTRTGKINYQAKFQILDAKAKGYGGLGVGALHDANDAYPGAIVVGNSLIAPGFGTLNAVDKTSGKMLWQTETPGIVTDITEENGTLLCQIGKMVVTANLEEGGKIKTKATGVKPYGFISVDAGSGKVNWSATDFKVDPTEALAATIDEGVLYGSDGEMLYALSLTDGKFKWQFDINKEGKAGKITGDKAWAVKVDKSSFTLMNSKTTTTTWSDPRRILRPEYLGTHFVVFGEKAIIRVNKDGKLAWTHKWKYDPDQRNLLFDPTFVGANDDVVYACKGFYGIDGKTGAVLWEDKDVKGEFTQVADDLLVVRKKDKVKGYSLK
jgi:outer membrane protein assembly factor BamB